MLIDANVGLKQKFNLGQSLEETAASSAFRLLRCENLIRDHRCSADLIRAGI